MPLWVMRTVGRERSVSGALYLPDLRITLFHPREHRIEVIDFDAEMVDAPRVSRRSAQKSETDIPIAYDDSSLVRAADPFRSEDRGAEHFGADLVRSCALAVRANSSS